MAGGRKPFSAEPEPASAPPPTGGQFLLQLLQKPSSTPPVPPDPLPHHHHLQDPAVAVVGPSHPVPPWASDPLSGHHPRFPPSPYPFPPVFSQSHHPWPLPSFHPPPLSDHFDLRSPLFPPSNSPFSGSSSSTTSTFPQFAFPPVGDAMIPPNLQMGLQDNSSTLTFGSLKCDLRVHNALANGSSSESAGVKFLHGAVKDTAGGSSRVPAIRPHERGSGVPWVNQHHGGNQRSSLVDNRRAPAATSTAGQSGRPKGPEQWTPVNGKWEKERNLEKGDFSHRPRLMVQLHNRAPTTGSKLHSVPLADMEESLENLRGGVVDDERYSVLQRKDRLNGPDGRDLTELAGCLTVRDEEVKKNAGRKKDGLRGKDFRLDASRGLHVSSQRVRSRRKEIACRSDIESFTPCFLSIYESLIPPEEEIEKQKQLLASLEKLVNKEWPRARLYLYGSCANSFGVSNSDIDVCMALDDDDISKPEILVKLAEILESDNLQNVQALTRARVPIVKLLDPVTKISCDICINNVLAVVNTKLLRDYAQIDVRLRQLAFIVKHWAKSRGVNETYHGTLSSYAYVLMCIHFLQSRRPAVLPCLQVMPATYVVNINDVECAYFDRVEELHDFGAENKESIAYLLWAFFNYWAYHHDYANSVISVRTGSIISKSEKDWTRRIGNDRHLICIEDPFEINHDLGRVVDKHSIRTLREEFERAAEVLQYDPNPSIKLFETYVPG